MTRAYREIYLNRAQALLGDAFDHAINTCGIPGEDFVKLFSVSSLSKRMENGEPSVLAGKSGVEAAVEVMLETTGTRIECESKEGFSRSREYWIGWVVAYYQWFSGRSFSSIFKALKVDHLQSMYYTLHEADVSKFAEIAEERLKQFYPDTNLKSIRNSYGCTQAELAKQSGVSLRSIQMYEQRRKDINKASVDNLYRIAKVLGCTIEELMER